MGPPDLITLEPPVCDATGTYSGGLAIERDDRCSPVKPGTRCYTIANSYQSQKGIWSPAQGSKVNGSFDENNLMRRNLNIVCVPLLSRYLGASSHSFQAVAPFPMAAMKQIPDETREIIDDYTSMLNIPALGLPGNTMHNTLQLNVAPAVPFGSGASRSLGFSLILFTRRRGNTCGFPWFLRRPAQRQQGQPGSFHKHDHVLQPSRQLYPQPIPYHTLRHLLCSSQL